MPTIRTALVVEVEVDYDYFPAEPDIYNHPSPEAVDITALRLSALLPGSPEWDDLEQECLSNEHATLAEMAAEQADHKEELR
jgi:hypothetical protein